jgi:hypothetical protein
MALELATPISIPAKTADKLWVTALHIIANDTTKPIRVMATLSPYVSATNELVGTQKQLVVNDLFAEVAKNPKVAAAAQALFEAVQDLADERNLF